MKPAGEQSGASPTKDVRDTTETKEVPSWAPLRITTPTVAGRGLQCEPVTIGVPLPHGWAQDARQLTLADDNGRPVPCDAVARETWPDGSVRWALLDFQIDGPVQAERQYKLGVTDASRCVPGAKVSIAEAPGQLVVDTGAARFVVRCGSAFPCAEITAATRRPIDGAASQLRVTRANGRHRVARVTRVSIAHRGDLRATIRLQGAVGPRARPWLQLDADLEFFAGSSAVRVSLTLRNPRRAAHPGGFWELGGRGSLHLRDASLRLAFGQAGSTHSVRSRRAGDALHIECAPDMTAPPVTLSAPLELYQDSSGGENWRHATHINRNGDVPVTFRGYRLTSADSVSSGLRATPVVHVSHPHGMVGVAVPHFWQNCPAAIRADSDALTLQLFPSQYADSHELQGGEQKTHVFTLTFGDDRSARDARFWGRAPAAVRALPSWYAAAAAMPFVSPAADDADDRYQRLVGAAVDGPDSFERKREAIDEYGWRNFGDIYADHENAFSGEQSPIVSHYNNQYDAIAGFAAQLMRTGDVRWQQLMNELAAHVRDIDIYHTDRDKSAYNHGLFWHTAHYVAAGRSSHRTFPRHPRVHGGGPANEHNYTAGLRLHWLLTGDSRSRDAVLELAGWVIAMDDGRRNILRWLSAEPTGLASQTYSADFHGPGRGAGNSILALLDGHRVSHEQRFLDKAEQLIARCIHPADDIAALNLLDAERRWSYTVFLQALGKYLDYKIELGDVGARYAYARAALLHYARWMAEHEYPYLDKPEILEYPTETWAAQDVRKAEVFLYAAGHAAGAERTRFLERARFFFDTSVSTLLASPTRTLARAVVLLLSNGFMYLSGRAAAPRPAPDQGSGIRDQGSGPTRDPLDSPSHALAQGKQGSVATASFGEPQVFVPQKTRAKKRLFLAACLLASGLATATTLACLARL